MTLGAACQATHTWLEDGISHQDHEHTHKLICDGGKGELAGLEKKGLWKSSAYSPLIM